MDYLNITLYSFLILCYSIASSRSNNDTSIECTMNCSVKDESLSCWNSTEAYFVNQLINTINSLSGVEEMIVQWNFTKSQGRLPSISEMVQEIINRTIHLNQGPLDNQSMETILNVTLTETLMWASEAQTSVDVNKPQYSCPLPEDYLNDLWIYMFACICVVLVLTLVYVAVHMRRLKLELKKERLL